MGLSYALIITSQADQLVMPTVEHEPAWPENGQVRVSIRKKD